MRESRSPGSVRGVLSNGHSYRDRLSKDHSKKTLQNSITVRLRENWLVEVQRHVISGEKGEN